jgi:hypothetical protein
MLKSKVELDRRHKSIKKGGDEMPNQNGTGPEGLGPMTGGGWGLCNPSSSRRIGRRVPYLTSRRLLGLRRGLLGMRRGLFGRGRGMVEGGRRWR